MTGQSFDLDSVFNQGKGAGETPAPPTPQPPPVEEAQPPAIEPEVLTTPLGGPVVDAPQVEPPPPAAPQPAPAVEPPPVQAQAPQPPPAAPQVPPAQPQPPPVAPTTPPPQPPPVAPQPPPAAPQPPPAAPQPQVPPVQPQPQVPPAQPQPQVTHPPVAPPPNAPLPAQPQSPPAQPTGLQPLNFGDRRARYGIEKFKAQEKTKYRIAVLSTEIFSCSMHYEDGIGPFYCFGGVCCDVNGNASLRYILPILKYDTESDGKIKSAKFDVMYLATYQDPYDNLIAQVSLLQEQAPQATIMSCDFLVTCDDAEYQKLNFTYIMGQPKWQTAEKFAQAVMLTYQQMWPNVGRAVARRLTREQYLAKSNEASSFNNAPPPEGDLPDGFDLSQFTK